LIKKEAEFLDKNTNVSVLSKLSDNKYIIRFNGHMADSIRRFYLKDPLKSDIDQMVMYTKENLRKSGLNKKINVPSAVHIAAAIASYARININEYKNIPGNPCIMSDTDSAVLPYPLANNLVAKELGQMKLEQEIVEGIFIRKNFYYIRNSNNQEIIKASGIDSSRLNYESFKKLLNGETISITQTNFNVDWTGFNIKVVNSDIIIHGLQENIKTLYNTQDVNYKYISFPIKYNKKVHPLYPIADIYSNKTVNKIYI